MDSLQLHQQLYKHLHTRTNLPHALLLTSKPGLGEFEFALAYTASLLCEKLDSVQQTPCGNCISCQWLSHFSHPDCRLIMPGEIYAKLAVPAHEEIEGATENNNEKAYEIVIAQIRELEQFLSVGSQRGGLRIVIIYPCERMNRNAANALLKMLEEPPAGVLFLLVATNPAQLLPTIRSRCQRISLNTPERQLAIAFLQQQQVAEPEKWLARTGGAPYAALNLAQQGEPPWMDELLKLLLLENSPLLCVAAIDKKLKSKNADIKPLPLILYIWQQWLHDLNLLSAGLPSHFFVNQQEAMKKLISKSTQHKLLTFSRQLNQQKPISTHTINVRTFLEAQAMAYSLLFKI